MFSGRKLLIATIHGKEKVLGPLLEAALGVRCILPPVEFNSDDYGTFTGEVERKNDPLTTLRQKCLGAMKICSSDLAVATEGSFGPHPEIPFTPANDELIILIDLKNRLEITARELSPETNYNSAQINTPKDMRDFALKTGFPDHRLILSYGDEANRVFIKNISSPVQLFRTYSGLCPDSKRVFPADFVPRQRAPIKVLNTDAVAAAMRKHGNTRIYERKKTRCFVTIATPEIIRVKICGQGKLMNYRQPLFRHVPFFRYLTLPHSVQAIIFADI